MRNLIPAAALFVVFLGMVIEVQRYPMDAKRFPFIIGLIILVLTSILIVRAVRPSRERSKNGQESVLDNVVEQKDLVPGRILLTSVAWIVGILLSVYFLGYLIGLPLYVFLYCKLHGGKWLMSISLGLGVLAFIYLVFVVALSFSFPKGLLFELLM